MVVMVTYYVLMVVMVTYYVTFVVMVPYHVRKLTQVYSVTGIYIVAAD